jgi:predicted nucleotidyltransferase component of viral defense system
MIPQLNITAWSAQVPWGEPRQVEQDLIISRAVVDLFSDPFLRNEIRFRGGTALNKLHFPKPLRYSEDIDLVRTTAGPIDGLRSAKRSERQDHPAAFTSASKQMLDARRRSEWCLLLRFA